MQGSRLGRLNITIGELLGPRALILLIWMILGFAPRTRLIVFRMFAASYQIASRR